jgi:hypothetical protein
MLIKLSTFGWCGQRERQQPLRVQGLVAKFNTVFHHLAARNEPVK